MHNPHWLAAEIRLKNQLHRLILTNIEEKTKKGKGVGLVGWF